MPSIQLNCSLLRQKLRNFEFYVMFCCLGLYTAFAFEKIDPEEEARKEQREKEQKEREQKEKEQREQREKEQKESKLLTKDVFYSFSSYSFLTHGQGHRDHFQDAFFRSRGYLSFIAYAALGYSGLLFVKFKRFSFQGILLFSSQNDRLFYHMMQ